VQMAVRYAWFCLILHLRPDPNKSAAIFFSYSPVA
jgi:hypothetical protein